MRILGAFVSYLLPSTVLAAGKGGDGCKCTPNNDCWPSPAEWSALNKTLSGNLIRGVPPASVCYPSEPNYNEERCAVVLSQWFNSTWHAEDPISIDYPIWVNNSCDPIHPNGISITGDVNAGKKGCTIGNYPAYAINVKTAEHVSTALKWAAKRNVRVIVKNTGHSYQGRSVGYGSLSIWTHHLRGIEYIDAFKPTNCPVDKPLNAVRIAAGQTGYEVQAELAKRNMVIVTGGNPDVGLAGWLTGGGHGFLSSTYGMGADNLLEATIVTPDGKTLIANPCKNSDIFFAIRGGGGGTYGVVLEVVVNAFPSPQTTAHIFKFSSLSPNITTEYWDTVAYIHTQLPRLKEGGMQGYYYMVGPPTYPTLAFLWAFYLYNKPNGTVEALMAPIEDRLKSQANLFLYFSGVSPSRSYWDTWSTNTNGAVANGGSAYGSRLLSAESLKDPNVTARVFASIGPSPLKKNGPFGNPSLLGHLVASPNEPSYYPNSISMNPAWRRTLAHFIVVETWRDGIAQDLIRKVYDDITYNKTEPLRKLSPDTGAYFNEADSYEPEWQNAFFGKHYERLKEIKEKYDPKSVLWCRRCVGSEALVEQNDGTLCKPRGGYEVKEVAEAGMGKGMYDWRRGVEGDVAADVVHAPHTGDIVRVEGRDGAIAGDRGEVESEVYERERQLRARRRWAYDTGVAATNGGHYNHEQGESPKAHSSWSHSQSTGKRDGGYTNERRSEDGGGSHKRAKRTQDGDTVTSEVSRKESGWNRDLIFYNDHEQTAEKDGWGADYPTGRLMARRVGVPHSAEKRTSVLKERNTGKELKTIEIGALEGEEMQPANKRAAEPSTGAATEDNSGGPPYTSHAVSRGMVKAPTSVVVPFDIADGMERANKRLLDSVTDTATEDNLDRTDWRTVDLTRDATFDSDRSGPYKSLSRKSGDDVHISKVSGGETQGKRHISSWTGEPLTGVSTKNSNSGEYNIELNEREGVARSTQNNARTAGPYSDVAIEDSSANRPSVQKKREAVIGEVGNTGASATEDKGGAKKRALKPRNETPAIDSVTDTVHIQTKARDYIDLGEGVIGDRDNVEGAYRRAAEAGTGAAAHGGLGNILRKRPECGACVR